MKKQLLFLLLLSFFYQNTSSFWILTAFYLNQTYIAENICVNRFDAIPLCYGSCYLQSELSEDSDKKTELPQIKSKEIQPLFHQTLRDEIQVTQLPPVDRMAYATDRNTLHINPFIFAFFQPPEGGLSNVTPAFEDADAEYLV